MSKKQIPKFKEINPLLKSLNIEKMNSTQIELEIIKEQKLLEYLTSNHKYSEAELCDKKIIALNKILKRKKIKEINHRHAAEKENLKIDEFSDLNNLKFYWDQKFEDLQSRSQKALDILRQNQELEYQTLISKKYMRMNLRPSRAFLDLQKEEEGLARLKKFKEAEYIKKQKEAQIKKDMAKTGKDREETMKMLIKNLKQKQKNELIYLQNKIQNEFDELKKQKQEQLEFLCKKYSVKNEDLMNQQKRERNINIFNNYRKRIGQLQNNYEENFVIGQKEYEPQQRNEKIDQIYAELPDNKIEEFQIGEKNNGNFNLENNAENGDYDANADFNKQQELLQNDINKIEEEGN